MRKKKIVLWWDVVWCFVQFMCVCDVCVQAYQLHLNIPDTIKNKLRVFVLDRHSCSISSSSSFFCILCVRCLFNMGVPTDVILTDNCSLNGWFLWCSVYAAKSGYNSPNSPCTKPSTLCEWLNEQQNKLNSQR